MSGVFRPRLDILATAQRRLWPELKPATDLGFALYGGTAIALHLGHRPSLDFDLFSAQSLHRDALHAAFPFMARATIIQDRPDSLSILVPSDAAGETQVKLSFFGGIDFGRVGEPELTEDRVLQVASLDDLLATKLKVMLQRAESKDYRDIAAMIGAGASLSKGLAAARALYGRDFQPSESLKALVYFEGGDLGRLTQAEKRCLVVAAGAVRDLAEVAIVSRQLTR